MSNVYQGILLIGDPHLASRTPGFRKDDYMEAILKKLEYSLTYAKEQHCLPIILGDLFHWPRDNSTRLLTRLIRLFEKQQILSVTGNHDTTDQLLQDDDSLALLSAASSIYLIDRQGPWKGLVNKTSVLIGCSAWNEPIPDSFQGDDESFTIWITHHDVLFPGVEQGREKPRELSGINLVINGHIHRPLPDQVHGMTTWMNPGNIARVQRSDKVKHAVPSVLKLIPFEDLSWKTEKIKVPHEAFDKVFYPLNGNYDTKSLIGGSAFIQGLKEIESMRTSGGAGLVDFIQKNIGKFEKEVAEVILNLAKEVCPNEF